MSPTYQQRSVRDSIAGLGLVVGGGMFPSFGQSKTTTGTSRIKHKLCCDATGIQFAYYNGSTDPIQVAASMDTYVGTFGGDTLATIAPRAWRLTDPIDLEVVGSSGFFSRTFVNPGGGTWSPNGQPTQTGEGQNYSGAGANLTASGSVPQDFNEHTYGPSLVLGAPVPGQRPVIVGIAGDSIAIGSNDTLQAGWIVRALNGSPDQAGYPLAAIVQCAVGGTGGEEVNFVGYRYYFGHLAVASHVIVAFGINDVRGNSFTLAQMRSMHIANARQFALRGQVAFQATILPTSGGGALSGGQETVRVGDNTWLRDGAPIDPTTMLAVATGTSGAVRCSVYGATGTLLRGASGAVDHWLRGGVIDVAATIETSLNSGVPTGGMLDTDGTHPTHAGHLAMAAAFPLVALGLA